MEPRSPSVALESDGSVTRPIPPREPPRGMWYIDNHVEAPGYGHPGCPPIGTSTGGSPIAAWDLMAYVYDYRFGPEMAGILGYHWHETRAVDPTRTPGYHVKCLNPVQSSLDPHYRGVRMDIWEARDELTRLDASGEWRTCRGLRRLP